MSRIHVEETDEAFINRVNLRFVGDEDRTGSWAQTTRAIETWQDVFRAFILNRHGPNGELARLIMCVLLLDVGDAVRVQIDLENLAQCLSTNSKALQKALLVLEEDGWICRGSGDEGWLEPSLMERAKRLYVRLAHDAGCSVYFDDEIGTYSATKDPTRTN